MQRKTPQKINRRKTLPYLIVLFSLLFFVYSWLQMYDWLKYSKLTDPALPNPSIVITEDTGIPKETKPKGDYSVPEHEPKKISLNSIGASGFIQKVGINSQNSIAVPNNVHFGGWFVNSEIPGEPGLSIIAGHVSGRYNDGIFHKLHQLNKKDVIRIDYGDNSIKAFEVIDIITTSQEESSTVLFEKRSDIPAQLNLITCGGLFDKSSRTFNDRVVVITKLMQE